MKTLDQWLNLYARDHKNPINQKIHKVCVPLIMLSLFGLLWTIPTPKVFGSINWAMLFCIPCTVFYILLSKRAAFIMVAISALMLTAVFFIDQQTNLLYASLFIFVTAWIGQFIGHKIEGQKPSFLEDLQFLLIGPLWVFKKIL